MNETRATLQIQSAQFKILELQVGQMAKILLEKQQRSLPTLKEPIREEVDTQVSIEQLKNKEESTSPKSEETNEEVEIIL